MHIVGGHRCGWPVTHTNDHHWGEEDQEEGIINCTTDGWVGGSVGGWVRAWVQMDEWVGLNE